ncbi:histone-lysine N-methyltransferase SETD1B-like [Drosophila suzukii]|uniref:Histone-lysine N-methyltransferase SETD1B-like n=1 Tax=Drosophila suzukii TaxID=28584 RepID=A0ABM4TYB5_DROSZ
MRPQGRKLALILEWQPRRSDLGADYNPEWYSGTSVGTPDPRNRNYNNRMEPFYPYFVAGVYQPVDHRDSDTDTNDGGPPSRDSVLSDRSPTPPRFSPILSLQSREARNGDSISTVPWSPDASIAVSGEPPAAFAVGASGDEDDDPTAPTVARLARLQIFESGEPGTATVHRSVDAWIQSQEHHAFAPGYLEQCRWEAERCPSGSPMSSDDSSVAMDGRFGAGQLRAPQQPVIDEANRAWEDYGGYVNPEPGEADAGRRLSSGHGSDEANEEEDEANEEEDDEANEEEDEANEEEDDANEEDAGPAAGQDPGVGGNAPQDFVDPPPPALPEASPGSPPERPPRASPRTPRQTSPPGGGSHYTSPLPRTPGRRQSSPRTPEGMFRPHSQRSPHPISPGLGTSARAVPQTPGRTIAPSELGWEPDLKLFLSREEEDEVLQALRECPDAGQVMEEAQWIVAPVGWKVDTHQRRLPTALVASIQEQDRRRVRYLRQIEGHRFRVTITAGREVIVSLRHNHAEEKGGCEDA